ncbi:MAG TPA: transposase [Leucothrix mucor]|nr:transposase [Leucothrix mucor]
MPRSRYKTIHNDNSPYFISSSIVNWMPLFGNPSIAKIIINSLTFLQQEKRLSIHAYVLMENHLHLVASSPDLPKAIRNFKSFTALQCIEWYQQHNKKWTLEQLRFHRKPHKTDQQHQFWQEGYHPKLITDEAMLKSTLDYIHNNPIERGYVDDPAHWRYSSYRNFMEMEDTMLDIDILR